MTSEIKWIIELIFIQISDLTLVAPEFKILFLLCKAVLYSRISCTKEARKSLWYTRLFLPRR